MRTFPGALLRLALALLALALAALAVGAQPARAGPVARPALWKLADADTTIYLFGTIHALPPGVEWLDGDLAAAFDRSDELVTEVSGDDPAQIQALLLARAALPRGKSLRAMLAPAERRSFEAALAATGLPPGSLDRFEPWYAAISLSTLPLIRAGYALENGAETALETRAIALGRRRAALETADYQFALFDTLPLAVQKRYLAEVVRTMPTMAAELAAMLAAWQTGDAETLAKLINAGEDDPELVARLITGRNRAWADWIARRMTQPGTVFVAVGAGHLAGTGSVQDELSRRGLGAVRVQ